MLRNHQKIKNQKQTNKKQMGEGNARWHNPKQIQEQSIEPSLYYIDFYWCIYWTIWSKINYVADLETYEQEKCVCWSHRGG